MFGRKDEIKRIHGLGREKGKASPSLQGTRCAHDGVSGVEEGERRGEQGRRSNVCGSVILCAERVC